MAEEVKLADHTSGLTYNMCESVTYSISGELQGYFEYEFTRPKYTFGRFLLPKYH